MISRSQYNEFKRSELYAKLINILKIGEQAAIEYWVANASEDSRMAVKTYREVLQVLDEGDILVDVEDNQ